MKHEEGHIALKESFALDKMTDSLALYAYDLARSVIFSKKKVPTEAKQDALGRFAEKITKFWRNLDPNKKPKGYITTMAYSALMDEMRRYDKHRKGVEIIKDASKSKDISEMFEFEELVMYRDMTRDERIMARGRAIQLWRCGYNHTETAREIGVDPRTIRLWIKKFYVHGWAFARKMK